VHIYRISALKGLSGQVEDIGNLHASTDVSTDDDGAHLYEHAATSVHNPRIAHRNNYPERRRRGSLSREISAAQYTFTDRCVIFLISFF
jgi:hypothetical protein